MKFHLIQKKIFRILNYHFLWIPKYCLNPFSCYYLLVFNDSTEWLCFCFWSEMLMHFYFSWCCAHKVSDTELRTVTEGRPPHWWDINFRVAPLLCVCNLSPIISVVTTSVGIMDQPTPTHKHTHTLNTVCYSEHNTLLAGYLCVYVYTCVSSVVSNSLQPFGL